MASHSHLQGHQRFWGPMGSGKAKGSVGDLLAHCHSAFWLGHVQAVINDNLLLLAKAVPAGTGPTSGLSPALDSRRQSESPCVWLLRAGMARGASNLQIKY